MNSILHARQSRPHRASGKTQRKNKGNLSLVKWLAGGLSLAGVAAAGIGMIAWRCAEVRYDARPAMRVPLAAAEIDASYDDRRLLLIQRDSTHYDFILEPTNDRVARVAIANVDVAPLAPRVNATGYGVGAPQQLSIDARAANVEIHGGDGFEAERLASIVIASDDGRAGGWRVSLCADVDGASATYYAGEFQFPLGHYRELFEQATGLDYVDYRRELESSAPLVAKDASESAWR